ncbi:MULTISPECIES: RNA polymerase sigma-70 factor [Arcicella]|uniref:RNA polymerase sigma-70 factor n=1 Tax=Arcicella aquatica TaxID=217141 RepID=A0ABU5QLD0_9BACT|nr:MULTISPECIES: RNA polymerase sigma-70 factor [Arcicella]MDR6561940.1 RNA polymerase sigma-70 factor (ECF subfamily) [Arcicella sp. BE51]MDR6811811.1 RNA polymerase sigma-70 factor (ECF subfamily) [Arcicella sp. BE140]MDR6822841.1 RNA polymerase sigma-70 factor (ECF subfamily) [Arcicella sp. BE139]MEA5257858.1 RNA polymerase sigma-70 factor [Arcicella aquatica]
MTPKFLYDEKELLTLASSGHEQAFTMLFHAYKNKLYGYLYRLTDSNEITEDIIQELFLKLWKDKSELVNIVQFDAYLFRMAKNQALNAFKSMARQTLLYAEYFDTQSIEVYSTDNIIQFDETQKLLKQIIENLPPQQKLIFKLSREQHLKHDEIADMLNLSPSTVKNHIIQALNTIKHKLKYQAAFYLFYMFWIAIKK